MGPHELHCSGGSLITDAYKPRMARLYVHYLAGVRVEFCLNVRRTPCPLLGIKAEVGCLAQTLQSCVVAAEQSLCCRSLSCGRASSSCATS